jgi:hypothetical protein
MPAGFDTRWAIGLSTLDDRLDNCQSDFGMGSGAAISPDKQSATCMKCNIHALFCLPLSRIPRR